VYKLICIDMDGTLLNDEKKISIKNHQAIKEAYKRGVKVVVCTGRLYTSAFYYSHLLEVKTPVIASNGAVIKEKDNNKTIYRASLGIENCYKILEVCKKYNFYAHFNTEDTIFTEKIIHSSQSYAKINESMPKEMQIKIEVIEDWDSIFEKYSEEIVKCIVIDEEGEKISKAKRELAEISSLEVVSSFERNFEVMSSGVSKGRAAEILAKYYDFSPSEVICIGDNENDLSMIKYAGLGVAMGNAIPIVKSQADYITATNNDDGVAEVIEKFVLI